MELASNPFFVLRVGTQHTRQEIIDAAEALALEADDPEYAKARAVLTHPRNRIGAEIGWLPGVAPKLALMLADRAKTAPQSISEALPKLPPLARCNLAAMLLGLHKVKDASLTNWLHFVAKAYDEISPDQLAESLNADRATAGFSAIPSGESLESELSERRIYLAHAMRDALDKIAAPDAVMTALVERATDSGKVHGPALVEELVDKYQIEVQKFLDQLEEQIRKVLDTVCRAPTLALDEKLALIEEKLRAWAKIARPIQILMQSKGLDDEASGRLASELRRTAVALANEHNMHEQAAKISAMMADVFKELPLFSQAVNEDISALKKIMKNKETEGEEWESAIALDMTIGTFFKDRLTIDPECIRYNRKSIELKDVDRLRWGILIQYVNGVKSASYYTVWIGSPDRTLHIECSRTFQRSETAERSYEIIMEKLWRAVGTRLLNSALSRLSAGEKIRYGRIVVDRDGITLPKKKLFSTEYSHTPWEDVRIGNGKGTFFIESSKEKNSSVHLAYREVENVIILENMLRFLWKEGNIDRLKAGQFR